MQGEDFGINFSIRDAFNNLTDKTNTQRRLQRSPDDNLYHHQHTQQLETPLPATLQAPAHVPALAITSSAP